MGRVIASEAKQSMAQQAEMWIASPLALLAMTVFHGFAGAEETCP
jgi:hypothetical protein